MEGWQTILSSVGLSAIACSILVWICREWISARLQKSIQHEYDVKLEEFKAGYQKILSENETRFSWWHEEKAKAIKAVYGDLADITFCLQYLQTLETDPRWQIEGMEIVRKNLITRFTVHIENSAERWLRLRLFLDDEEDGGVSGFRVRTDKFFTAYAYSLVKKEEFGKEGLQILAELNDIMECLRHCFQDVLQGKRC